MTPAQRALAPYAVAASHIYGVPAAQILALAGPHPTTTKRLPPRVTSQLQSLAQVQQTASDLVKASQGEHVTANIADALNAPQLVRQATAAARMQKPGNFGTPTKAQTDALKAAETPAGRLAIATNREQNLWKRVAALTPASGRAPQLARSKFKTINYTSGHGKDVVHLTGSAIRDLATIRKGKQSRYAAQLQGEAPLIHEFGHVARDRVLRSEGRSTKANSQKGINRNEALAQKFAEVTAAKLGNRAVKLGTRTLSKPYNELIKKFGVTRQQALAAVAKPGTPLASQQGQGKQPKQQRTVGKPTGPLTPSQIQFGTTLAKRTGLSPHVIAAWMLAEESSTAAQQRDAQGYHNWLNIGPNLQSPAFNDPHTAAIATAKFLKGKLWGAGANIPSIIQTAGKSDAAQMAAIEQSGFSGTGYGAAGGSLAPEYAITGIKNVPAGAASLPKPTITRFQAIVSEAKRIDSAKLPYVLGGGHVSGRVPGPRNIAGYDCSGVVSKILQKAGALPQGAMVSGGFMNYGKPGPGAVTIYANAEHVFMKIGNRYFGTSHSNPAGGAGFIPTSYEQGEAQSGRYVVRHVPGLGQDVAARLGVPVGSAGGGAGTAPGMITSANGTTAQIAPGQGAIVDKPGPSSKPIRFAPAEIAQSSLAPSSPLPFGYGGNYTQETAGTSTRSGLTPRRRLSTR